MSDTHRPAITIDYMTGEERFPVKPSFFRLPFRPTVDHTLDGHLERMDARWMLICGPNGLTPDQRNGRCLPDHLARQIKAHRYQSQRPVMTEADVEVIRQIIEDVACQATDHEGQQCQLRRSHMHYRGHQASNHRWED